MYRSRAGGALLKDAALANFKQLLEDEAGQPQYRLFSLRDDFRGEWNRLQTAPDFNGLHTQTFRIAKRLFGFPFQAGEITVNKIQLFGMPKSRSAKDAPTLDTLTLSDPQGNKVDLKQAPALGKLVQLSASHQAEVRNPGQAQTEADWTLQVRKSDRESSLAWLEDLLILYQFSVAMPTNR
jgi:hypothetical protein